MVECVEYPTPEDYWIELSSFHSQRIKLRVIQKLLFGKLKIKQGVPDNGQTCKNDVVKLINPGFIKSLARKQTPKTKIELYDYIKYIFVKIVTHQISVSSITFSTVN